SRCGPMLPGCRASHSGIERYSPSMQDIESFVPGFRAALDRAPSTRAAYQRLVIVLHDSSCSPRIRAQLGLLVAHRIGCEYCQWAFGRLAASAGLNAEDILLAGA